MLKQFPSASKESLLRNLKAMPACCWCWEELAAKRHICFLSTFQSERARVGQTEDCQVMLGELTMWGSLLQMSLSCEMYTALRIELVVMLVMVAMVVVMMVMVMAMLVVLVVMVMVMLVVVLF